MLVNVNPKNDYVFKLVFGSELHTRVLIHLLNAVLGPWGLKVHRVRILNPLNDVRELDEKKLILDVKATDDVGRLYNIEMQMIPCPSSPSRFLYYWADAYRGQLSEGEGYELLCPVISICFVDGIMFPKSDQYHLRFRLLETTRHFPYTTDLDMHVFQLPLFTKTADELENDLDLWLYILNNGKGLDLEQLHSRLQIPEVEEALTAMAKLTEDRMQREIYQAREKARRDLDDWRVALERAQKLARENYSQGRDEGRDAGLKEGRDAGLKEGFWIGRIRAYEGLLVLTPKSDAELAGLTESELRGLAEELYDKLSAG